MIFFRTVIKKIKPVLLEKNDFEYREKSLLVTVLFSQSGINCNEKVSLCFFLEKNRSTNERMSKEASAQARQPLVLDRKEFEAAKFSLLIAYRLLGHSRKN